VGRNRIGRNDPCWCDSGKKYKKCHLGRESEAELPLAAVADRLRDFFKTKQCLHPEASPKTCGKVIAAHTIQRQGPLEGILDTTGHCLSFFPPNLADYGNPQRRGWRAASTFLGFCQRHDGPTFAPLENTPFSASPEQCFLLGYRAECHELYQKHGSASSHEPIRQLLDRGRSPQVQREIQEMQRVQQLGVLKGLEEARRNKTRMDAELLANEFGGWKRLFVRFTGPLSVVSTGAPTPNRGIRGAVFQTLHDPQARIERLHLGVVRDGVDSGAVVLQWRDEDRAPERFASELLALPVNSLPGMLVQFMFAYIENTYFSKVWWDLLAPEQKQHISALATMGNPYYVPWNYLDDIPVPWEEVRVSGAWTQLGQCEPGD
jgi:hypothetical protein